MRPRKAFYFSPHYPTGTEVADGRRRRLGPLDAVAGVLFVLSTYFFPTGIMGKKKLNHIVCLQLVTCLGFERSPLDAIARSATGQPFDDFAAIAAPTQTATSAVARSPCSCGFNAGDIVSPT